MRKEPFTIATLSGLSGTPLAQDPVTIITAGATFLSSIFPNLFGTQRHRMTDADWQKILPGAGFWTVRLRNYYKAHIDYDTNLPNMAEFVNYFVHENQDALCGVASYPAPYHPECKDVLFKKLQDESVSGGTGVPGVTFPGSNVVNWQKLTPWLIGGLAVVLVATSGKKKRR